MRVAVVAGFQGVSAEGRVTTLGRGGSDTTAVAFAAAFDATRCDIYTDVDGIYTTDPRISPRARRLERIAYEEMLELASLGAKVLQTRSVELAMRHGVRLRVLSSLSDGEEQGTLVCPEEDIVESQVVSGVTYSRDEAKLTLLGVRDRPGVAAAIFGPLARAGVNVDMIVQNVSEDGRTDMTFSCPADQVARAERAMREVREAGLDYRAFEGDTDTCKVSVVGIGMRSHAGRRGADVRGAGARGHQHQGHHDLGDQDQRARRPALPRARRPGAARRLRARPRRGHGSRGRGGARGPRAHARPCGRTLGRGGARGRRGARGPMTADPVSIQGPPAPGRGAEDGTWRTESESRRLLGRLREAMAEGAAGQARLDRIVALVAESMRAEVCSAYLFRDPETLELCATQGLRPEAVHKTRMRLGEGLVGRVAREGAPINAADAPSARGYRYMPETGEERFSSFLGVPIQRLGERLGVLVVQSREARAYTADEIYALEIVAMVLAEMAELGALTAGGVGAPHRHPVLVRGTIGQEGSAGGHVWLHEPRVVVTNPIGEDPAHERERLRAALGELRGSVDRMLDGLAPGTGPDQREVLEAYRMFAGSRGWPRRMEEAIEGGLSAEAAVEKEQSAVRARMSRAEPYLRERLQDLDDLSNRLLRILTGQGRETGAEMPGDPVLVARNIGPGDLLDYGRKLCGIVLEEGSVGSHAAIVARALAIPLVIQARGVTAEALNGDRILVDGDQGVVHLRPGETVEAAFRDKMAMRAEAQARYASLRGLPAQGRCGTVVALTMNAGLMADLPSLEGSGAEGVGLFRTELQFLARSSMPKRGELAALYARVMDAAKGRRVVFRTLDIGSDKVLPFMKRQDEPNPALGWRAIRVGLDKRGVMRMQLQALIRAANGRPLTVMFPFVAQMEEFCAAREHLLAEIERERKLGHVLPSRVEIGAMLETPRSPSRRGASSRWPTSCRSAATTSSSSSSPPTARTSACAGATTRSTSPTSRS